MKDTVIKAPLRRWAGAAGLICLGFAGGGLAYLAGLPMPFMLGSLFLTAVFSIVWVSKRGGEIDFPPQLRKSFIATIGVMIGAGFSPELFTMLPLLWLSLLGVIVFVPVTHALSYFVFRRVGKYDPNTALFASMPGGLIEAVTLGGEAGGDVRVLTVQHFARIIIVVVTVPVMFFIWSGEAVGSAAGEAFSEDAWGVTDLVLVALIAAAGLYLGPLLRLPASHLMGPLLLSGLLHSAGVVQIVSPAWLLYLAQVVIGAGLGANFSGSAPGQLVKAFSLGVLAVAVMLAVGFLFAAGLSFAVPVSIEALFISFAPGGVTEMGLIALSLNVSPVIVAVHHLFRIVFAVLVVTWVMKVRKARGAV